MSYSDQWVRKHLHGISWDTVSYPCWFLSQVLKAITIFFSTGKFYAKGEEKIETLPKLHIDIRNLETLFYPKIDEIFSLLEHLSCSLLLSILPFKQKKNALCKEKYAIALLLDKTTI